MSLRDLAEGDLAFILEDTFCAGSPFTLIDPSGVAYPVAGLVGDIGLLIAPETGERIRSRSIVCSCRIKTLAARTEHVPCRGWRIRFTDLSGGTIDGYVEGCNPDRTLGVYNLVIGLDVEERGE